MLKGLGTCAALVALCGTAHGDANPVTDPLRSFDAEIEVDSGLVQNVGDSVTTIFTEVVSVPNADWLRLTFNEVTLSGSRDANNASYLKITSLEDGAVQYLDRTSAQQWGYTSAYFNGDTVIVELVAHPGTGVNELTMSSVIAGDPVNVPAESICGSTDDRILSSDPRAARALPIGCTAWMIDDSEHCFLTAGHCNPNGNSNINVIEFNVPLSDNSCSFGGINHPGPEDQYAVDAASQQTNGGQGVGSDWGYLGVFPNSNTGLLPWQAQGEWYTFAPASVSGTTTARVTGYGSVSSSLAPCSWYAVQKTHSGPFFSLSGNALDYGMDTTGGNSGSPVLDDDTGLAIGIHTHGGCSTSGGENHGTWGGHPALQNALANPTGVCLPQGPMFSFPGGIPDLIPQNGTTIDVTVTTGNDINPVPSTATLLYTTSTGFVNIPLAYSGGDSYSVTLPGGDCADIASLAFSIQGTDGETYTGPSGIEARIADGFTGEIFDMNTAPGWTATAQASVTTGDWQRVVPGDYGRSDPSVDADGSGQAYVTDNGVNADVDGGIVTLTTAVYDASSIDNAEVSYSIWHQTNDSANDVLTVEVSNDGGSSWTLVESIGSTSNWEQRSFALSSLITPTSQMVFRFTSRDVAGASITESALDDFRLGAFTCDDACLADTNGDGELTPADFNAWVAAFNAGSAECDQNGDGECKPSDFNAWVANFNAGC
ncbi:MAG: GC-type dockerin domain-anchored protein [Planctomycetota bacterium]